MQTMAKSKYIVLSKQTLMDVAMETYGDVSGILNLIEDNPELTKVQEVLEAGQVLFYDESITLKESNIIPVEVVRSTKRNYVVTSGQTLMDIAIEVYGDISGILRLIEDNPILQDIESKLSGGQILRYDKAYAVNQDIVDYYSLRKVKVNTGEYEEEEIEGLMSSEGTLLISVDDIVLKAAEE